MIAKGNMHEVRFPNVYILSHIIYYINCCFDNKNSWFFKGQAISKFKICNALC